MWNNCTEGNCDNYPTNAEHFVFQERSNTMQPGTQFAISAMVWQHPEDALQDDAKFELVIRYFGLGEGGSIDNQVNGGTILLILKDLVHLQSRSIRNMDS